MDPILIGIIAIFLLLVLVGLGVPITFALGFIGLVGNAVLIGPSSAVVQIGLVTWENVTNFLLMSVPLFILMGQLVFTTGLAKDLYECFHKWFGAMPGGLAVASVATSTGFGAVTGSSVAAVATMGTMVMPQLRRFGYNDRLGSGSIASAGTLAILIPPSIPLVVYGVWTETSIGALFMAGILPGIVGAILFSALIVVQCLIRPELGPRGPSYPWADRVRSLGKLLPSLAVFAVVIGGIYGGLFTPTEASAMGCIAVMAIALAMKRLSWTALRQALHETGRLTAMVFAIMVSGFLFSRFMVQTGVTPTIVSAIGAMDTSPFVVMAGFVLVLLVLGAFLETRGIMILTLPFMVPVILQLGYDTIWFGIFLTLMIEVGLITPPVGLNVYVMKRVVPNLPMGEIFMGCLPFVFATLFLVALVIVFPEIVLWLPSTMAN